MISMISLPTFYFISFLIKLLWTLVYFIILTFFAFCHEGSRNFWPPCWLEKYFCSLMKRFEIIARLTCYPNDSFVKSSQTLMGNVNIVRGKLDTFLCFSAVLTMLIIMAYMDLMLYCFWKLPNVSWFSWPFFLWHMPFMHLRPTLRALIVMSMKGFASTKISSISGLLLIFLMMNWKKLFKIGCGVASVLSIYVLLFIYEYILKISTIILMKKISRNQTIQSSFVNFRKTQHHKISKLC